jgi:hypothetical protein
MVIKLYDIEQNIIDFFRTLSEDEQKEFHTFVMKYAVDRRNEHAASIQHIVDGYRNGSMQE